MAPTDRLSLLGQAARTFARGTGARVCLLLDQLGSRRFRDAESLILFHETLLFLRAHPHTASVLRKASLLLATFAQRVELLRRAGADLDPFETMETAGIAGTGLSGYFSLDITRWLLDRYPAEVDIDWDSYEESDRLTLLLPRLLPLFEEESLVEANIPQQDWLRAGSGRRSRHLHWLLGRYSRLDLPEDQKAALYEAVSLPVRWDLRTSRASRTRNIRTPRRPYFHKGPLIQRREVSLEKEIRTPIELTRLSPRDGRRAVDMLRAAATVRYRELHGITYGDTERVLAAWPGRGVEIFLWGLPPERRLPLRAYHAGITLKNGVPVNYIEGITLFERMELGFNTFYSFRDGESAWVYAQVLRALHHLVAATCISVDPYQIGWNNEEAIESGAFWFYRKLGFRSTWPKLAKLTGREEERIRADHDYRTSPQTLRRLSRGHIIYELPGTARGDWDRFTVRGLALALQREVKRKGNGGSGSLSKKIAAALGLDTDSLRAAERKAFAALAPAFAIISDLDGWNASEKQDAIRIIRAKAGADEARYARLLQKHTRLRKVLIRAGSANPPL
jgi:hypothetical protein